MKIADNGIKSIISRYSAVTIIVLYVGAAIYLAGTLNIWVDEAFSLKTTQSSLKQTLVSAIEFEGQPPGYFILLWLWRKIDSSMQFARLFSVLCIFVALVLVIRISRRLLPDIHPSWVLGIFASSPLMIWFATEMRCYALAILLSVLLGKLFLDAYLTDNPRKGASSVYGLVSIFALYTFYFLGFLLVANAIALIALKRWRPLLRYALTMLLAFACIAPVFAEFNSSALQQYHHRVDLVSLLDGLKWVGNQVRAQIIPFQKLYSKFFLISPVIKLIFWPSVLIFFMISMILMFKRGSYFYVAFATTACVLWIGMLTAVVLVPDLSLSYRHAVFIFPFSMFAMLAIARTFFNKRGVFVLSSILTVVNLAFFVAGGEIGTFRASAKWGDWARVASYIEHNEKPGQPIIVYRSLSALPLEFHYAGANRILPIPRKMNMQRYVLEDFVIKDDEELDQVLSTALRGSQSFWLVTDDTYAYRNVVFSHKLLNNFVGKRFNILATKHFYGTDVKFIKNGAY